MKPRKLADFRPATRNTNRHTERGIGLLDAAMQRDGYVAPITVAADGEALDGSARLERAFEHFPDAEPIVVEHDGTRPIVMVRTDVPNAQTVEAHRIAIAANRIAQVDLEWDEAVLGELAADLPDLKLGALGLDDAMLSKMGLEAHGSSGGTQEDEAGDLIDRAAELQKKWKTERGQLWTLGEHRLLCGDSTVAEDVACVMGGERAGLMNTDPPYGIDYVGIKAGIASPKWGDIENDDLTDGAALQVFLESAIRVAIPHLVENVAFYLWHPMLTQGTFFAAAAAAAADILIHRQIIWVKPHMVLTRSGMYHWKHELCFYGWIRGKPCKWLGNNSQVSVWEIGESQHGRLHPTTKPVELFAVPMRNHLAPGEIAYEPFSGSGSQIIAAEQLGRRCFAIEIEPKYVAVALERWSLLTGKAPEVSAPETA